jgi:hypothetical protein
VTGTPRLVCVAWWLNVKQLMRSSFEMSVTNNILFGLQIA